MGQNKRTVSVLKAGGMFALAMLGWAAVVGYGVLAGWWHRALAPRGDLPAFMAAARLMVSSEPHGAVAIALVTKGQLADEYYTGVGSAVNRETVFPVASVSKWATAVGVMQLAREGRIKLDAPVAQYLTRWTLPPSPFDLDGVTARRLMSHTAGLTDGLGFADYRLDERVPPIDESLRAPRASTGQPTAIAVGYEPGSRFQYSGGGYLILQLLVEDVAQQPFADFMRQAVLDPLQFSCSSFERTPSSNAAPAYDAAGGAAEHFQYAAAAATGFSTCVRDMVRWVQAHLQSGPAAPLDADLQRRMREPHGRQFGADIWGLGTMLYAPTEGGGFVFGHDGQNEPAINAAVRINSDNGDAIVVLTSGGRLLATRLGSEWTYWQTGGPDFLVIGSAIREAVVPLVSGWAAVMVAAMLYARVRRRTTRHAAPDRDVRL
jgi:CubicO group peptidase (beta-lactamase class C family)